MKPDVADLFSIVGLVMTATAAGLILGWPWAILVIGVGLLTAGVLLARAGGVADSHPQDEGDSYGR